MAKEHAEAALRTLLEIAIGDGAASARFSAATAILDRAYGKPSQAIDLSDSATGSHITVSWIGDSQGGCRRNFKYKSPQVMTCRLHSTSWNLRRMPEPIM